MSQLLCGYTKRPQVVEAFRVEKDFVYVMINLRGYFRLDGFQYTPGSTPESTRFEFKDITSVNYLWANIDPTLVRRMVDMKLWFHLNDTTTRSDILVGVTYGEEDNVDQVKAYTVSNSKAKFEDIDLKPLNINVYKYEPNADPNNLMSLLAKFPQQDIETRIHAINYFPVEDWRQLPERYFVYYLEKRPAQVVPTAPEPDTEFRRHIFVKGKADFGHGLETDWHLDNSSGRCFSQNVVNASFTLTHADQYNILLDSKGVPVFGVFTFDLIEFSND
ncbi:unnamed protein product, partial [Medioppia subpectinata]